MRSESERHDAWKNRLRSLRRELRAVAILVRHPRVRWHTKALAGLVVAYAVSPIDLIPDFIPVIGYLDDLLLVPIGIWLVLKTVPPEVVEECRVRAASDEALPRWGVLGAALVVLAWALGAALVWLIVARSGLIS